MAIKIFKEPLNGKYDFITPPTLLPVGGISDGRNVRKVSPFGGWKARKGCTHHNTTQIAAASILSLHQYTHPRNEDYHFLAQCNGGLYDATNDPPASGTTFGSAISSDPSSTVPGFSDMIEELFFYADGGSAPIIWGGDDPFCSGFVVHDDSEDVNSDYTREVTDDRTETEALVLGAANDEYYVCSPQIAEAITLVLGDTVNDAAETAVVYSWQAGAWADRSATDGTLDTATSTKTHAKSGAFTWTRSASDTMRVINGMMGYWYKIDFTGALSGSVDVVSCKVKFDPAPVTNKWNGVYEWPTGVRFYDQSATEYVDYLGTLTNESTSQYLQLEAATTTDFIYVKSVTPLCGIGFAVVPNYENTDAAKIDNIDYWDGDSWVTISTGIIDETLDEAGDSSFAQTGTVWWNAAGLAVKKRTMDFDSIAGFWYRVSWDVALGNTAEDIRLFAVTTALYPEQIPKYKGVIEFKSRAFFWPDPEYPNRLRYSAAGRPDCLCGKDSGYTDAFGNMEEIVSVVRFYNELLVFKANSVWLLEGENPKNFGTLKIADTIGTCAAKTPMVSEVGFPGMHRNEALSVCLFMDTDGVYVIDGRKPRKVSGPVDQYFNTEYTTAMAANKLGACQAFIDPLNNEYHLLTGLIELVYNYVSNEWYPPWERTVGGATDYLICGTHLRGTGGRYYTYAGNNVGRVLRLEDDTTDKSAPSGSTEVDAKITHSIRTRAICVDPEQATIFEFNFRRLWAELKARGSGSITTNFYKNLIETGVEIAIPSAMSLVNSGYTMTTPGLNTSQVGCTAFQLEFIGDTADLELEIWSFLYELEAIGEIGL